MSSQAITSRIKAASELRDLCLKLGEANPLAVKEEPVPYKISMSENERKKKEKERRYLCEFLKIVSSDMAAPKENRERPDFLLTDKNGRKIGCELVEYHCDVKLREVEESWEFLQDKLNETLGSEDVNGHLLFKRKRVPSKRQTNGFIDQLQVCMGSGQSKAESDTAKVTILDDFSDYPLLSEYLKKIKVNNHLSWSSNIDFAWFGLDQKFLLSLLNTKGKHLNEYRNNTACDEYWLLVVSDDRLSQSAGPNLLDALRKDSELSDILKNSGFDRVYFYQYLYDVAVKWPGWTQIRKRITQ
jgi:hypothetical protein